MILLRKTVLMLLISVMNLVAAETMAQASLFETIQPHQMMANPSPAPQALYFVSFSIPKEGLAQMVADAHRLRIPAVLRGMVDNDMRVTANAVLDLLKENPKGGVQLDPTAFQKFNITAVPTLVVTCDGRHDRIAGSIRIDDALKKIAESGDCAAVARQLLTGAGAA